MQLQLSLTKEEAAAAAALAAQQSDQALRITNTVPNPSKPPPVKLASHPPNPALVATVKENSRRRKMRQEQANRLRTALKIEASTPKDNCHRHHHHDCVEDIVKRNRSDKIKINANRLLDASSRLWKVDDAPWGYYKQPSKSSSEGQAGDDAGWSLFEENEKHQRFFEELQECTMPLEERIILPEISQELTIPKYVTPKKKKEITQIAFGSKYICGPEIANPNARLMKLALHHGQGRRLKKDKIAMSINASSNNGRGTSRDALSDSSNSSNREDKRLTVTEAMLSLQLSMVIKADNNPREEAVQLMYILRKHAHERSEKEISTIFKRISHYRAFEKLSRFMLSEICGVIKVMQYDENRVIFRQGDEGTCWYIVLVGEVKVIKEMESNSLVLANLVAGDGFGEVALVNDSKRMATVLSSTKCLLLQLEKNEYNRIVKSMHMKELQEKLQFLTKDTVARDLTTLMRLSMANVLKLKSFKPGEIIVKELDLLTEFFFVKRGSCSVFKTLPDGKTLVKMGALAIGEHFGEVLVHRNPSQAKSEYCPVTIKADGEVEIGCLTAADAWTKMSRELEIGPFFKIEKETVEELHAEFIRKRDWTHNKNKMVDALLRERFRNPLITAKKYRTTQNFSMLTDIRPLM